MWQNIVPLTVLQRALRILLGSLFLAVAWLFVSAASSVASDLSAWASDTTRTVQGYEPALKDPGASLAGAVLDKTIDDGAVANGASTVTGLSGHSAASATSLADPSLAAIETTTRNVNSTAASVTPTGAQAISKPLAAVVDSAVHHAATAVKPILTKVASLPDRVVEGVVPEVVTLPVVAATPAAEAAAAASVKGAPASPPVLGTEAGTGEGSSRARSLGTQFVGIPAASGKAPGMAAPGPDRPDRPSSPSSPPAGAGGGASSEGPGTQQLAGTIDTFAVPFNPASELRTRSSGPDPHALNRHPGFSPD